VRWLFRAVRRSLAAFNELDRDGVTWPAW